LLAKDVVEGPALVEESISVTTVPEAFQCEADKFGNLIITKKEG